MWLLCLKSFHGFPRILEQNLNISAWLIIPSLTWPQISSPVCSLPPSSLTTQTSALFLRQELTTSRLCTWWSLCPECFPPCDTWPASSLFTCCFLREAVSDYFTGSIWGGLSEVRQKINKKEKIWWNSVLDCCKGSLLRMFFAVFPEPCT